jgi:hypothetical protein
MELEPSSTLFEPVADDRPRLWQVPPVRVVAIADVTLTAIAGLERQLDSFYAGLLQFERETYSKNTASQIVYRAENVRLRLTVHERPPERIDLRPLIVALPNLGDLVSRLNEREMKYVHQPGLLPGTDCIILKDPAGNFIQAVESVELI